MPRTITNHEMDRRKAMSKAACVLTESFTNIECPELTAVEWIHVLQEAQARMIARALKEQFDEDGA